MKNTGLCPKTLTFIFCQNNEKKVFLGGLIVYHLILKNHILPKYDESTPFLST